MSSSFQTPLTLQVQDPALDLVVYPAAKTKNKFQKKIPTTKRISEISPVIRTFVVPFELKILPAILDNYLNLVQSHVL